MCAKEVIEPRPAASPVAAVLCWLGGGHWAELGGRQERSTHAVAGAVVLLGATLAALVGAVGLAGSTHWSPLAVAAVAVLAGLLAGVIARATAAAPPANRLATAARASVAAALGVVVGEFAVLVLLSGSIDHRVDQQALRDADATPAVAQAAVALQRSRDARHALDVDVDRARERQDNALVIARCEFHPSPGCPQTRITGVPGAGPEARTANDLLADAQHELDSALAVRDSRAPGLDAEVSRSQRALDEARRRAAAEPGLGARWIAMNDVTLASPGALALRVLVDGSCVLLYVLPLLLAWWRGESTEDRRATARVQRERAELEADTAIAIKRAEIRREAEILWAEHQLTQARLAIEAQREIDREQQRRRVAEALDAPVRASSQRNLAPADDDVYLPIAAAAEAASRTMTPLPSEPPAITPNVPAPAPENLPAPAQPGGEVEHHEQRVPPLIPSIPDVTKVAARWLRPLIPPLVARVVDTTTHPLRSARHVVEEVLEETEEITFALRRTRKVRVSTESSDAGPQHPAPTDTPTGPTPTPQASQRVAGERETALSLPGRARGDTASGALGSADRGNRPALSARTGPPEIGPPDGPRQLPPAK